MVRAVRAPVWKGGGDDRGDFLPALNLLQAIVLGVVEGLTEFLPVSSTGHLTITEKLMGLTIDSDAITGFTAVVQLGAIAAVVIFFRTELARLIFVGLRGLTSADGRRNPDFRLAWSILAGSIPIGIVGIAAKDVIEGPLRSIWVVAAALIAWSAVMVYAENHAGQRRSERDATLMDLMIIGVVQCFALIPGVSRSGATISAGLVRGIKRVDATRISFLLSIPALVGAGLYELKDAVGTGVGVAPTLVATAVAFVIAYVSIAWLLRFVAHHAITAFVPYRVGLGVVLFVVLAAGGLR